MALQHPCYFYYRDQAKEWRWRYYAVNGRIIAVSSESYKKRSDCRHAITLMQGSSNDTVYVNTADKDVS